MEKREKIMHGISVGITLGFLFCGFLFPNAFTRLIESFRDIETSATYWFNGIFELGWDITPTVSELPSYIPEFLPLPSEYDSFKVLWSIYWRNWADSSIFRMYTGMVAGKLAIVLKILMIILPLIMGIILLLHFYSGQTNTNHGEETRALKLFKRIADKTYLPVKKGVTRYFEFLRRYSAYQKIWLCLWLFYFNVFSMGLELIAFYLYFIVSFDFLHIYRQIYKLIIDLWTPLNFIPIWAWVGGILYFFLRWRKKIGYEILERHERRNRGFINEQPIALLTTGVMRSGKDLMDTDMAISVEILFRNKALELMQKIDLFFPMFPWICFETQLRRGIADGRIYNLATAKKYVLQRQAFYENYILQATDYEKVKRILYGYDIARYGDEYDDKLKVSYLFDSLVDYAKLYFIYVIECSLIYSNLAVREDFSRIDNGNFPLWDFDLFHTPSVRRADGSYYSHILDMDTLRDGKKVEERNRSAFEFGIVYISEIQNERKNDLALKEVKANEGKANQKNDGFESRLKTIGHGASIMGFCFVRFLANAQRPEDWGARGREVCSIVRIRERSETKLALPFFGVEDMLYEMIFNKFTDKYLDYRFRRGDTSLPIYLFKAAMSKIYSYYNGIYNTFGYMVQKVGVEAGVLDGRAKRKKYYLASKKIFANRYKTDFLSTVYEAKASKAEKGILNTESYAGLTPKMEEMIMVKSYYYDDLIADIYRILSTEG